SSGRPEVDLVVESLSSHPPDHLTASPISAAAALQAALRETPMLRPEPFRTAPAGGSMPSPPAPRCTLANPADTSHARPLRTLRSPRAGSPSRKSLSM